MTRLPHGWVQHSPYVAERAEAPRIVVVACSDGACVIPDTAADGWLYLPPVTLEEAAWAANDRLVYSVPPRDPDDDADLG